MAKKGQKEVQIIGLTIKEQFGYLKASELKFSKDKNLFMIKGEVGAGKSTLNKAMRLTTQGSNAMEDKSLFGNNINIETQLCDGETPLWISCKSSASGALNYVLYTKDSEGNKIENPVIDGKKATPANYLKSLQTELTWRLDELTSENPTTQRNLLLELYADELEKVGVVFDKKSPNYVGGIIDQIEKAKNNRSFQDMKRKEVGGIAEDLKKKGIDFSERRSIKTTEEIDQKIQKLQQEIFAKTTGGETKRENELLKLKQEGSEVSSELKKINDQLLQFNAEIEATDQEFKKDIQIIYDLISKHNFESYASDVIEKIESEYKSEKPSRTLEFSEKGSIISKPDQFFGEVSDLLSKYHEIGKTFATLKKTPIDVVDVSSEEKEIEKLKKEKENVIFWNETAKAVNAFQDWKEAEEAVLELKNDYYKKLTEIETGVDGLKIVPSDNEDKNEIFLMYDGTFDPEYFSNPNQELRKLSSYSDTQKPMICLLIQNYLLSKKSKILPYLWIDHVPIDKKTKDLLDRMAGEFGLKLFVSWTGDFNENELNSGEILVENGEIFFKE